MSSVTKADTETTSEGTRKATDILKLISNRSDPAVPTNDAQQDITSSCIGAFGAAPDFSLLKDEDVVGSANNFTNAHNVENVSRPTDEFPPHNMDSCQPKPVPLKPSFKSLKRSFARPAVTKQETPL